MYSEAIMKMPVPQLWSVLYFIMLLLLGVGSMLGNITAIITPLRDFRIFSRMRSELVNGEEGLTSFLRHSWLLLSLVPDTLTFRETLNPKERGRLQQSGL